MKTFFTFLVILLLNFSVIAQRQLLSLDGDWSFCLDADKKGISSQWFKKGLPQQAAYKIKVPHTWNIEPGKELIYGYGWYELTVKIPKEWNNQTIRIQFDAVYHDAYVWVNGQKVSEHLGSGFTQFFMDISKYLKTGKENKITVCADNSYSHFNIPFTNSFDWPNDGGIIRSVSLVATNSQAIEYVHVKGIPDLSNPSKISNGKAEFTVALLNPNKTDANKTEFDIKITEENQLTNNTIFQGKQKGEIKEGKIIFSIPLTNINAWHFDATNLYKAEVTMIYSGQKADNLDVVFGFRDIRTKGEQILFNGEPVRLMGVEWMPGSSVISGIAETKDELVEMARKLKSVNCMFTRFHWQQDDAVYDWFDRNGILVQEEIPYWGGATMLTDTMLNLGKKHLDEMISAHYNHPSIICWGVGNELDAHEKMNIESIKTLYKYTKSLDDTRLVNYVSNTLARKKSENPNLPDDASYVGDLLMWNEYQDTWYTGDPARIGGILDTIHLEYPGKPLLVSEYGLCEPANQGGDERRARDMIYHTAIYESKPYMAGAIYFCLNDYRTHIGESNDGNIKQRVHGVFDIYGKMKPSADILKIISSPVEMINLPWKEKARFELILNGSVGFPSFTMRGYKLYWSETGTNFRSTKIIQDLPDIKPNQQIRIPFEEAYKGKCTATITRTDGSIVIQRNFEVK